MCSDCSELTEAEEARRDKVWEVLCSEVKYFISQLQPLRIVSGERDVHGLGELSSNCTWALIAEVYSLIHTYNPMHLGYTIVALSPII